MTRGMRSDFEMIEEEGILRVKNKNQTQREKLKFGIYGKSKKEIIEK